MAIELGANLLGEIIIFTIGAGVLILEYQRQSRKETLKEEMAIQEKLELQSMLNELAFQAERQDTQIRELTRILADIGESILSLNISIANMTSYEIICLIFFLDSKSWTPKILNDIVGRKKVQGECKEDNPLELLPEKRTRIHQRADKSKKTENPQNVSSEMNSSSTTEPGKEHVLIHSINYLITEVFCSRQQSAFEEMKGDSVLTKSLNYLFIDAEDVSC